MSQAPRAVVDDAYAAFDNGDIPAVLGLLSEDVQWSVPDSVPHGRDATGPGQVGEFFGGLVELWTDFGIEIDAITDEGEKVISIGRAAGKLDGTPTSYGFVRVFTVDGGRIVRFDEYVAPPNGGFPGSN
jgi:ketosteroid isomerase-like protein